MPLKKAACWVIDYLPALQPRQSEYSSLICSISLSFFSIFLSSFSGFKINCTAETFSCSKQIKCTWTSDEFTAFRLRNARYQTCKHTHRYNELLLIQWAHHGYNDLNWICVLYLFRDNGDWVSQSVDGVFFLPHSTNSFSEESERLLITGEAVSTCCYMKTDYSFYLRDIGECVG